MDTAIESSVYVTSPEYAGWLMKRGFRWRKKWKRRWVALHGMELVYMDKEPTADNISDITITKTILSANCDVIIDDDPDGEEFGFSVHVNDGKSDVWYLRAEHKREKNFWVMRLKYALAIVKWMDAFEKVRVLGVGVSGIVHELCHKETGQRFALKEMEIKSSYQMQMAIQEATMLKDIMEHVSHPNIMHIEKVFQVGSKFYMVFPLCLGGELYEHIVSRGHFSERDAAKLMKGIISGLSALHDNDILHLDIKPENILFESKEPSSDLKITDFGLSRIKPKEEYASADSTSTTTATATDEPAFSADILAQEMTAYKRTGALNSRKMKGTIGYMSPELILCGHQSKAADIFAAGVVLYILLSGSPPFKGSGNREVLHSTLGGQYRIEGADWDTVSSDAKDLVRQMLNPDPFQRIAASQIMSHPWLQKYKDMDTSASESPAAAVAGKGNDLSGALRQLSGHVNRMRSEKMAMNMTRLISLLQLEQGASPLSEECLGPLFPTDEFGTDAMGAKDPAAAAIATATDSATTAAATTSVKVVTPEEAFRSLTSGDIKLALARVINRLSKQTNAAAADSSGTESIDINNSNGNNSNSNCNSNSSSNSEGHHPPGLSLDKFIVLLESLQDSTPSSMKNSVGLLLFCRFVDRDGDGFITLDDIIAAHVMIAQRSEKFVKLVFRMYAEALWYPGKHLNVMRMMSESQRQIGSPATAIESRETRTSSRSSTDKLTSSEVSIADESIRGNSTSSVTPRGSKAAVLDAGSTITNDIIDPPKFITEKHVSAVFEKLGFDPLKGQWAFRKLCEVVTKVRSSADAADAPYHHSEQTAEDPALLSSIPQMEEPPSPPAMTDSVMDKSPAMKRNKSVGTASGREASIERSDTNGTTHSSSMEREVEYKMDERTFASAAEIDEVFIQAVLRRTRGKLMQMLLRAKHRASASAAAASTSDCNSSSGDNGGVAIADEMEREIWQAVERTQASISAAGSETVFSALGSATAALGRAAQGLFFSQPAQSSGAD